MGFVDHAASPPPARAAGVAFGIAARIAALDWSVVAEELDAFGCAATVPLLTPEECALLAGQYDHGGVFRSKIVMARHGFGRGEYQHYGYPLPEPVAALYPHLGPIANLWHSAMTIDVGFPPDHATLLARCHASGQTRTTPLPLALLR